MSILDKALLVTLNISLWYNRATDKKISDEVAARHGVEKSEDRYVKTLIGKSAVRKIEHAAAAMRGFHNENTLPWRDGSVRILSSANFFVYREGMYSLEQAFNQAIDNFIRIYPQHVDVARLEKRTLFNEAQYPTPDEVRAKYDSKISFMPFPNVSDFRIQIADEELEKLKKQSTEDIDKAMNQANQYLIGRLYDRVHKFCSTMTDPDKTFRDTTVTSVLDTADIVERLNVTGNMAVASALACTHDVFEGIIPAMLRNSPDTRSEMAYRARELLVILARETDVLMSQR